MKRVDRLLAARCTTTCSRTGASSGIDDVAIVRVEQLYPFPHERVQGASSRRYPNATEVVWCQEEPQNQGAWYQLHALPARGHATRGRCCATPAVRRRHRRPCGYTAKHNAQQKQLVEDAFATSSSPAKWSLAR